MVHAILNVPSVYVHVRSTIIPQLRSDNDGDHVTAENMLFWSCVRGAMGAQGGVKSTPSSPRLRVEVILTDPEPVKEAL